MLVINLQGKVNLLPGFESYISTPVDLLVCSMLLCLWEYDWLICERKASVRRSFWWLLVVLPGFIASLYYLCRVICCSLAIFVFRLISLVWVVFFVLICHNMILCRSCTNLACQLLAFNEILIFQKKWIYDLITMMITTKITAKDDEDEDEVDGSGDVTTVAASLWKWKQ